MSSPSVCAARNCSPAKRRSPSSLKKYEEEMSSSSETSLTSGSEAFSDEDEDTGSGNEDSVNEDSDIEDRDQIRADRADSSVIGDNAARKPQKPAKMDASGDDKKSVKGKKSSRKSKSPRTKKKKYPEPESILREVPLKPPNTQFAHSDKANRTSLYQNRASQKVEFSPDNVVCTFGTTQNLSNFKKKLVKAKESFDSSAPFPSGSAGQTPKSILKK